MAADAIALAAEAYVARALELLRERCPAVVIAAESLFLDKGVQGELKFRLSTRAASFADGGADHRRQILKFVQKAHDARSSVVHTGRLDERRLRNLQGRRARRPSSRSSLKTLLGRLLKRRLD